MKKLFLGLALIGATSLFAQEKATEGPTEITHGTFLGKSIPLRNMPTINELRTAGIDKQMEIKQRFDPTEENLVFNPNALPADGEDPVRQTEQGTRERLQVIENFDGITVQESGGFFPPDPTGAVGPNHYVNSANSVVKIFDKTGNLLAGPTSLGAFLGNGANNGDPIVMYDQLADRFFVSQFQISNNALIIGISDTADPTGSYNVYEYSLNAFPDYPHYTVWHDGYYLTANKNNGNTTYVLDRQAMLDGDVNPAIIGFNLPQVRRNPATVFSPEPAHLLGSDFDEDAPGYIVYLQDDAWSGISFDHLKVWEIDVDFATPGNSTISANPLEIPTQPFDSFLRQFGQGDIDQPGTTRRYDAQSGIISYAANYRRFTDHNSWVITFNTDIGGITPGIRWIELRNDDTNDWSIFQEGTYAPADGEGRFMSSAAMDIDGNIGMGYSLGSGETFNSIKYTGRFDGDELGVMTFPESTILDGTGRQTFTNRFGDYAHLSMDPDGSTFWFTTEYFVAVNQWRTRIASFKLNNGLAADVGVSSFVSPQTGDLGVAETVTINVFNFGNNAQSNFEIELRVDGSLVATETFSGTLEPLSGDTFTFAQTVDLSTPQTTYEIEAKTILAGDENNPNDPFTTVVDNTLLAVNDSEFNAGDFTITPYGGRQYNVNFTTTRDFGSINYTVYNTIGQKIMDSKLKSMGNEHTTLLDFNGQPQGVFFVKLSNGEFQATKRILVN
ncbi:hypothetical protein ULMS_14550 [Patiriisocius marinistellae]|uniref:T9SS type A sorting domain-containing protein n=1 Tax=Patiriisocius marinistellae TaxID=2494560 RepID=A0A5J4FTS2_9FLAO|nr:T9SS type A sorting domain-containing protein [Patiriisocius marinistellae]GEQ85947.1 hypothetical protein ULMS_14550 [Patiriisocius marinistellae]